MLRQYPGAVVDAGKKIDAPRKRSSGTAASAMAAGSSPVVSGGGASNGTEADRRARCLPSGWWIVGGFMTVMMKVGVHQTHHQNHHH
jgi:hypothetical protein